MLVRHASCDTVGGLGHRDGHTNNGGTACRAQLSEVSHRAEVLCENGERDQKSKGHEEKAKYTKQFVNDLQAVAVSYHYYVGTNFCQVEALKGIRTMVHHLHKAFNLSQCLKCVM